MTYLLRITITATTMTMITTAILAPAPAPIATELLSLAMDTWAAEITI